MRKKKYMFRVDVVATVFVKATSFGQAAKMAKKHVSKVAYVETDYMVRNSATTSDADFVAEETPEVGNKKRMC